MRVISFSLSFALGVASSTALGSAAQHHDLESGNGVVQPPPTSVTSAIHISPIIGVFPAVAVAPHARDEERSIREVHVGPEVWVESEAASPSGTHKPALTFAPIAHTALCIEIRLTLSSAQFLPLKFTRALGSQLFRMQRLIPKLPQLSIIPPYSPTSPITAPNLPPPRPRSQRTPLPRRMGVGGTRNVQDGPLQHSPAIGTSTFTRHIIEPWPLLPSSRPMAVRSIRILDLQTSTVMDRYSFSTSGRKSAGLLRSRTVLEDPDHLAWHSPKRKIGRGSGQIAPMDPSIRMAQFERLSRQLPGTHTPCQTINFEVDFDI